jgi:hypothetical protein
MRRVALSVAVMSSSALLGWSMVAGLREQAGLLRGEGEADLGDQLWQVSFRHEP